jgi:hypothetical protein
MDKLHRSARNPAMSRRLTILIVAMACLLLGSVVVLVLFFRTVTANTLEFEVAKALLQVGVVSIVGAAVSLLTFEYQRERQALEYREGLVKSILDRALIAHSDVKKARRLLRARAIVDDGGMVSATSYDLYLEMINNAQLALENLARDIETSAPAFRSLELADDVWSMENYLSKLITEYETYRGKFRGSPPLLAINELPKLQGFIARGISEFQKSFVVPFREVQRALREELLFPSLPGRGSAPPHAEPDHSLTSGGAQ